MEDKGHEAKVLPQIVRTYDLVENNFAIDLVEELAMKVFKILLFVDFAILKFRFLRI